VPIALGVAFWLLPPIEWESAPRYETVLPRRGDVRVIVTATGALEPLNQVDVGSELSGVVAFLGADFNQTVHRGQVLARLNDVLFAAEVRRSRASLQVAIGRSSEASARVREMRAEVERLDRLRELSAGRLPSTRDYIAAVTGLERAEAQSVSAAAEVELAQANLEFDEARLRNTEIVSPCDGVVMSRNVEVGQTLASAFAAPVLFRIAEDLRSMKLLVDIDEADIGRVREGMSAEFTVDAYPERTFPARIVQVRFASSATEGVVTYAAELAVDNKDLLLRPGMTATANITVQQAKDALLVPNEALYFQAGAEPVGPSEERVWTLLASQLQAIELKTGLTDGVVTEADGAGLTEATPLVVRRIAAP
jgi:HlyD family secretion protein